MLVDESLNWKDHISRIKSKLSISVGIVMQMLYSTLFLLYLLYCVELWGNTYPTNLHYINMLQKRVIRLMHNARRCHHTAPLFYKAYILKFTDVVKFIILLFVYKSHKNELPLNIQRLFVKHDNKHCTRRQNKFLRTRASTNRRHMSLIVCGTKLWNPLNFCFTNIRSFHRFKAHYSKQLFESYGKQI